MTCAHPRFTKGRYSAPQTYRLMKNELSSLEQRWGLALQSASFGIWDLDPQAETVHYSPQWKAMLGYGSSDEPDSTATWRARVHPEDLTPMLGQLRSHLEGRTDHYEFEFRMRAADGSYRPVLSRGRVVERAPDGQPLRMIGTLTDLSARQEVDKLRVERDRAEAASRAKTELLARFTHEMRTPLNAVIGFAKLLSERLGQADTAVQRQQLAHIEQAGWQLLAMVDDVLDLADAERGQLRIEAGTVALAPVLAAAREAMEQSARKRGVSIHVGDAGTSLKVKGDAVRIEQALTHLLDNAVKFNVPGGFVEVDVTSSDELCTVAITDTGPGIPVEQRERLYEPFRKSPPGNPSRAGMGLGLALSRRLLEAMGGTLRVCSGEGSGTRVEVDLLRA